MFKPTFNPFKAIRAIKAIGAKLGLGRKADAFTSLASGKQFTRNEGRLDATAYGVKFKLGPSFFTRHLNPRMREKLIRSLHLQEKVVASQQGWLALTGREFRRAVRKGWIPS